jgi:predicted acyltransferase
MAAIFVTFGLLAVLSGALAACWLLTRPLPPRHAAGLVTGWTLAGLLLLLIGVAGWGWGG